MYSINNKEKSAVTEWFIRALQNKVYKYLTSISKYVYIDKLDEIVNKYNNVYYRTVKMKPADDDVKPSMYIDFNKENNKESPKFKVGDNVIIRKYKNSLKKFLWLKKLKKLCHKNLLLVILTEKK